MWTIALLLISNLFMTVAWDGHLRYKGCPLWSVVLVSWLIALPEYSFQVPANRIGYGQFTATQLKVIQEAVSLWVFAFFAFFYLGERPTWRTVVAFLLIIAAVALIRGDGPKEKREEEK